MAVGVGSNQITYKLVDISPISATYGYTLAELPLSNPAFTLGMNTPGPWSATLNVEDPDIQAANWIAATVPYQTALLVDANGTIIYYGPTLTRKYTMSGQQVKLGGAEWPAYFSQRIQNIDYSAYTDPNGNAWASTGASAGDMAYFIANNALGNNPSYPVPYSLPIILEPAAEAPSNLWITGTFPLTQAQTVASIWSQLTGLGYGTGVDYGCDPQYVLGIPAPIVTLSYPRRGAVAGESGLLLDFASAIEVEWDEDGSTMSNGVVEMLGASGGISAEDQWGPSMETYGFPLTEQVVSHAAFSPTAEPATVLEAFQLADLSAYAFPLTAPTVTMPLFNSALPIGSFTVGDDILCRVDPPTGNQPPIAPRWPNGLNFWMRIVRVDIDIPDYGVPTYKLTLNVPPGLSPTAPPA